MIPSGIIERSLKCYHTRTNLPQKQIYNYKCLLYFRAVYLPFSSLPHKKLLYIEKQSSGKSNASNNLSRWMRSQSNKHIETYVDKKFSTHEIIYNGWCRTPASSEKEIFVKLVNV